MQLIFNLRQLRSKCNDVGCDSTAETERGEKGERREGGEERRGGGGEERRGEEGINILVGKEVHVQYSNL